MINKEQSPTVKFSSDKDPDWFEKNGGDYGYGNYPESRYDNDGYDKRGYNEYGIDRAGINEDQYDEVLYNEILEDFKDIYIPDLSKSLNSSEFRSLDVKEQSLLAEKKKLEEQLKKINQDLENVATAKSQFGVSSIIESNVVAPKRGFRK
ncbi:hypothetical protein ACTOJ1_000379 [Shigella flexneri]